MTAVSQLCGSRQAQEQLLPDLQGSGTAAPQAAQAYVKQTQDLDQFCHNYRGI